MTGTLTSAFWVAKDEQAPNDWEDGAAFDGANGRLAVADGASAAYRAREWATHLVESYVAAALPPNPDQATMLSWFAEVASDWNRSAGSQESVEWYHRDAARRGSFAAFVGVRLVPSQHRLTWSAVAVGDCCLFQVRGDHLVTAFPISTSEAFTNSPDLVPSAVDKLHLLRERIFTSAGTAQPGDLLLLSSDALAKFLLGAGSRDAVVWRVLSSLRDNLQFADLIRQLRGLKVLDLDDVTLVRVVVTD